VRGAVARAESNWGSGFHDGAFEEVSQSVIENLAGAQPDPPVEYPELEQALKRLTPKQRQIIKWAHGLDGPSYTFYEIAEAIGVSQTSVGHLYGRGMRALRKQLGGC